MTIAISLATPVGEYQVVVVHTDAQTERFGYFGTEESAVDWAMQNRYALGLARSTSWRTERTGS